MKTIGELTRQEQEDEKMRRHERGWEERIERKKNKRGGFSGGKKKVHRREIDKRERDHRRMKSTRTGR